MNLQKMGLSILAIITHKNQRRNDMIGYADELLRDLRNILDMFNTYHVPIVVNGKSIKEVKLEDDSKGGYKINVTLMKEE